MFRRRLLLFGLILLLLSNLGPLETTQPAHAQGGSPGGTAKPFSLPFNIPPGPTTWLLSQPYGSTLGAYNYGKYWYAAGQNLHFGVDFWAACNTPVVAIADGVVDQVDDMNFGLEPHNLTLVHRELGYTSVYGHLNTKPTVMEGQPVKRGEVIGVTGDPDRTCQSRPHLHLEIRSGDYRLAYNPAALIEADWNALSTIGYHGFGGFPRDLYAANRWQTLFDQPDVDFNENPLNNFALAWPPPLRDAPSPQTLPAFTAPPIPAGVAPTFRRLTRPGCCAGAWWTPDSQSIQYLDGQNGELAGVMQVNIREPGEPQPIRMADAPPSLYSPDYQLEVRANGPRPVGVNNPVNIVNRATGGATPMATGGAWPRFSPGTQRLLWHRHPADNIPGGIPPLTEVWIARADGTGRQLIGTQQGGAVMWLDDDRFLRVEPVGRTNESTLSIYTISTGATAKLATVKNLRGLQVAPGGGILLFYLPFQDDPAASGVYGMLAQPGATPVRLGFFGSYRWRDSKSLLYMLYAGGPITGPLALVLYDVVSGEQRLITDPAAQPISILNDDWSISPDGRQIMFWNAADSAIWLITLPE